MRFKLWRRRVDFTKVLVDLFLFRKISLCVKKEKIS
jgi:hypothetical protein